MKTHGSGKSLGLPPLRNRVGGVRGSQVSFQLCRFRASGSAACTGEAQSMKQCLESARQPEVAPPEVLGAAQVKVLKLLLQALDQQAVLVHFHALKLQAEGSTQSTTHQQQVRYGSPSTSWRAMWTFQAGRSETRHRYTNQGLLSTLGTIVLVLLEFLYSVVVTSTVVGGGGVGWGGVGGGWGENTNHSDRACLGKGTQPTRHNLSLVE